MADDLRDDLLAAIDDDTPEQGVDDSAPETVNEVDATDAASATPEDTSGEPPEGKVRDSLGRFVPKEGQQPAQQAAGAPVEAQQAPTPQEAAVPPPASFSFGAREAWAKVPPQVQQEVARREHEMARFVTETSQARQLGERFYQTVQPFMPAIQAEGVDPLTAVQNLMQFGARMRMGTPAEKAATVAQIVKAYAVDIEALDSALVGAPMPQQAQGVDPGYVQMAVQQALQPLMQAAQQRQQAVAQQTAQVIQTELQQFAADPKNRYFADLRNDMADIIELGERQGRKISLQDAYHRAAMLHPEISKVMIGQQQGLNAQKLNGAAQRAKAAAVSVRGSAPVGNPGGPEPSSIRESIEAAIEANARF